MKLVKGVKTSTRKKTVAKAIADLPETATKTVAPAVKAAETTTGSARSSAKPVTIEAKIDVGFGNALYLRGEGLGLSWNQGVPLTCVDGKTWKWTGETKGQLKFKLLITTRCGRRAKTLWRRRDRRWRFRRRFKRRFGFLKLQGAHPRSRGWARLLFVRARPASEHFHKIVVADVSPR